MLLFPYLQDGDNDSTHHVGLLGELSELLYVKCLEQCPACGEYCVSVSCHYSWWT